MDVDLAIPGKNVSIAVPAAPTADLHDVLTAFEAGFIPTHTYSGGVGPTYTLRGDPDFQIDFVTTLGRSGAEPVWIETLSVSAQPLKFMDYLVQGPTQTALLDRAGRYAVVNVPAPARYAVHKLIVHGERDARYRTKARKDLEQTAGLFQWFAANDPRDLQQAWEDARSRGPGWRQRLDAGVAAFEPLTSLEGLGLAGAKTAKSRRPGRE